MSEYKGLEVSRIAKQSGVSVGIMKELLWNFVKFCKENGLYCGDLSDSPSSMSDDYIDDMNCYTEDGKILLQTGYLKYLEKFDRNPQMNRADTAIFERELKKIRKS